MSTVVGLRDHIQSYSSFHAQNIVSNEKRHDVYSSSEVKLQNTIHDIWWDKHCHSAKEIWQMQFNIKGHCSETNVK